MKVCPIMLLNPKRENHSHDSRYNACIKCELWADELGACSIKLYLLSQFETQTGG